MLSQSQAIQADQSAPLVAAEVRAAEAREGKVLPQFDGHTVVLADASGAKTPAATKPSGSTTQKTASAAATTKPGLAPINKTQDARVVSMLHAANQSEIKAGKLAEKNGYSKGVKNFGAMLVHDHEAADKKVLSYAKSRGIDPMMVPEVARDEAARERDDMARLAMLSGPAFDRGFLTNMEASHARVIDMVRKSEVTVTDPKLRGLLGDTLPTLQKHEQMARKLAAGEQTASTGKPGTSETHGRRPPAPH